MVNTTKTSLEYCPNRLDAVGGNDATHILMAIMAYGFMLISVVSILIPVVLIGK